MPPKAVLTSVRERKRAGKRVVAAKPRDRGKIISRLGVGNGARVEEVSTRRWKVSRAANAAFLS